GRAGARALPGWWSRCSVRWGVDGGADGSCRRRPQDAGQTRSAAMAGPDLVRAVGEAVALVMAGAPAGVLALARPVVAVVTAASLGEGAVDPHDDRVVDGGAEGAGGGGHGRRGQCRGAE